MSIVFVFSASPNDVVPVSPISLPVYLMKMEKNGLLMDAICVLSLLSSPLRSSSISAVFDFNASHSDVAPVSLILLTVDFMRVEKSVPLMDAICVLFLWFTTQIKYCKCYV